MLTMLSELQMQYSNFKDTLQNIASQIGNVEQEVEEHKYVASTLDLHHFLSFVQTLVPIYEMRHYCLKIWPPILVWRR